MEFPRETPVCLGVRAISRDWTPTRPIGPRSPAYNPRTRGGPAAAISVSSCAPPCGQLAGLVAPERHSDGLPWTPRALLVMAVSGSSPLVGFNTITGWQALSNRDLVPKGAKNTWLFNPPKTSLGPVRVLCAYIRLSASGVDLRDGVGARGQVELVEQVRVRPKRQDRVMPELRGRL